MVLIFRQAICQVQLQVRSSRTTSPWALWIYLLSATWPFHGSQVGSLVAMCHGAGPFGLRSLGRLRWPVSLAKLIRHRCSLELAMGQVELTKWGR